MLQKPEARGAQISQPWLGHGTRFLRIPGKRPVWRVLLFSRIMVIIGQARLRLEGNDGVNRDKVLGVHGV